MDLNEEQASELFPDDRGEDTEIGDFHLGIDFRSDGHVTIYTDDEQFILSEQEKDELLKECNIDSIWSVIANKFKALEHLRTRTPCVSETD